jgi:CRISPR-associated endonuclease/helicase Cas3
LTRERRDLIPWLQEAFNENKLIDGDYIKTHVIRPRIRQIESKGKTFCWHSFQDASARLPSRALLLSSCGSGKTLAAWRWVQSQMKAHPRARVLFLYPTRATATEGFRDYVSWGPEADVTLLHGTSAWELEGLFENPDSRSAKDFTTEARLFAIGFWHRRVFSATVDQFLGFMQHS